MQIHRLEFRVLGMKSIYCAERLRAALNRVPGVRSYVLFKRAYAEVEVPTDVTIGTLQNIAEQAGYRLHVLSGKNEHEMTLQ